MSGPDEWLPPARVQKPAYSPAGYRPARSPTSEKNADVRGGDKARGRRAFSNRIMILKIRGSPGAPFRRPEAAIFVRRSSVDGRLSGVSDRCPGKPTMGCRIVYQPCPCKPTNQGMLHRLPALSKQTNQPSGVASFTSLAQANQPTMGCRIVYQRCPSKPTMGCRMVLPAFLQMNSPPVSTGSPPSWRDR